MPIYEYRCLNCDIPFEKLCFRGDEQPVVCPKCGSNETKKRLSSGGFMNASGLGPCSGTGTKGFS
jgi:putative FmdB family regulatory protein